MTKKGLNDAQETVMIAFMRTSVGSRFSPRDVPDLEGPNGTIYGYALDNAGFDLSTDPRRREHELKMRAQGYAEITGLPVEEVKAKILALAHPVEGSLARGASEGSDSQIIDNRGDIFNDIGANLHTKRDRCFFHRTKEG
jgi:hypothetical protein